MTSGPLCLPIGNGRQASRTGPGTKKQQGRLFVAPQGRAYLLYGLFLVLFIVGCSSGQGRLEASSDTLHAEGAGVDTVAELEIPAEAGQTTEAEQAETQPSPDSIDRAEIAPVTEGLNASSDSPPITDTAETNQALDQARTRVEAWEEDGIREEFAEGYTRVVFSEILSEEGFNYSYMDDPPRLVVDVKEPAREVWFNRLSLKGSAFERIRVGRHPDKIRFVLDVREGGQPEPLVEASETDLVVLAGVIPEPRELPETTQDRLEPNMRPAATESAAAPSSVEVTDGMEESDLEPVPMGGPEVPITLAKADWKPVRVKGIDFRQTDSASEVIISTDGAAPFDVREEDDSIIVVLPGAQIPEHLQRPLDAKAFPSSILSVMPEQVGAGPTGKVMFTIRLREKRPYNVLEEENGLRVSVLLPETPPEIPLLPPPTLPETEGLAEVDQETPAEPEPPTPEREVIVAEASPPETDRAAQPRNVPEAVPYKQGLQEKDYTGKKISLDFKDADIQNVLRLIAEVSNKNIVISDAVKGKVTIRLLNVPWDMALDVILKTYALEQEVLGPNILRIAPYSQLKKEREEALKAGEALERGETLETRLLPVNYAKAKELESVIGRLKSKRPDASILVDTRTNSLIIRDLPPNIVEMAGLVEALDTQTPQVLIEAKIVELDVNFEQELGIQWGTQFNAGPATGNPTGMNFPNTANVGGVVDNITGKTVAGITNPVVNLPAAVDNSAGGALGFSLASITNSFQLDAQLSALEKRNHARILSSPRVATLNNQEARINQGQEVPYQTTSDEGTKTEFKEAVLALSVTPQITFDRSIIMAILVTNDTPIRDPTVGFIIGTKEARTTVLVKDGDTAVIGGIYTNNDAESLGGVPYLMDLPVAGILFKKKGETKKRTELIIFITPRIIPNQLIEVDEWTGENKPE